jgi:pimeloyl-ACP methyl ester carboxylesterase
MPRSRRTKTPPRLGRAAMFKLSSLRLGYAIGSRVAPARTVAHAARLFFTPFSSSRLRARAADAVTASRRHDIEVAGERIATYVWGDPDTQPYVLLVHGWSSFGLRYEPWVKHLLALGYALVSFDQPGHGHSGGRTCTLPDFIHTVREVGRHYGNAAVAIAHSLGGAAVTMAMSDVWRAERLVLIAPAADPVAATRRFSKMVHLAEHLGSPLHARLEAKTGISIHDLQIHRRVPSLSQPVLVVHDLGDREVPWDEGERYVRYWPGARLLSTSGLGHHKILDDPGVMASALAFMRGDTVGERVVSSPNLPFGLD